MKKKEQNASWYNREENGDANFGLLQIFHEHQKEHNFYLESLSSCMLEAAQV